MSLLKTKISMGGRVKRNSVDRQSNSKPIFLSKFGTQQSAKNSFLKEGFAFERGIELCHLFSH
jgi:hypothetical protein